MTDLQKIEWWSDLNKQRYGLYKLLDDLKHGVAFEKGRNINDVESELKEIEELMKSIEKES